MKLETYNSLYRICENYLFITMKKAKIRILQHIARKKRRWNVIVILACIPIVSFDCVSEPMVCCCWDPEMTRIFEALTYPVTTMLLIYSIKTLHCDPRGYRCFIYIISTTTYGTGMIQVIQTWSSKIKHIQLNTDLMWVRCFRSDHITSAGVSSMLIKLYLERF